MAPSNKTGLLKVLSSKLRTINQYSKLSKDKLSVWIVLSTLPGYFACGGTAAIAPLAALCVGTGLASSSACAFNQTLEAARDKVMNRTKGRPVACGKLTVKQGMRFSTWSGIIGTGVLAAGSGPTAAVLGAINIGAYAGVYTPMKVKSCYNTHVGAIVGSVPVLIGCVAAGAPLLSPVPLSLFAIQTLWQFPHFYALAWLYREDYKRGGFKMFPLSDDTGKETAKMMFPWLACTAAFPAVSYGLGWSSAAFMGQMMVPNLAMFYVLNEFRKNPSRETARGFFLHSLWYLFALLGLTAYHTKDAQEEYMKKIQEETLNNNKLDLLELSKISPTFTVQGYGINRILRTLGIEQNESNLLNSSGSSSSESHCPVSNMSCSSPMPCAVEVIASSKNSMHK